MIGFNRVRTNVSKCVDCGQRINDEYCIQLVGLHQNVIIQLHKHCAAEFAAQANKDLNGY